MIKLIPLKELFTPVYGVNLELIHLEECNKNDNESIRFVSRTESNNGVSAYVKKIIDITPNPAHTISVAVSGSVLSSFYQADEYYSGRDLYYLIPKKEMSETEMLFFAFCIRANKYKYNYGRAANRTLKDIFIPAEMPDSFKDVDLKKLNTLNRESILKDNIDLNAKDWKWFYINELFDIKKGERLVKEKRIEGKIPLITATSKNNGVVDFISCDKLKKEKKGFENKITIDMFFNVFYHNYKYFSDDNVHTLIPKFKENNSYIFLFLVPILKQLEYKYDYGRQLRLSRLYFDKIKLPIIKDGVPDFEFMENYIKSLPYSSSL